MRIHYLQHVPFEGPGCIADWAAAHGHQLSATRLFAGELPPAVSAVDWVVVMGGPMNVYEEDRYAWLADEKAFIRAAIDADKTVLGICLGAQLIADVLGGPVTRNPVGEIGWFPIELTPAGAAHPLLADLPSTLNAFHWHDDTFALPPGSTLLASSEGCTNQAFAYGRRVVGLQFHLEMGFSNAQNLIANCQCEIGDGPYMQRPDDLLADGFCFEDANHFMFSVLDRLAEA